MEEAPGPQHTPGRANAVGNGEGSCLEGRNWKLLASGVGRCYKRGPLRVGRGHPHVNHLLHPGPIWTVIKAST